MTQEHYDKIAADKCRDHRAAWLVALHECGVPIASLERNDWTSNLTPAVYVRPSSYDGEYCPQRLLRGYHGFMPHSVKLAYQFYFNN